MHSDLSEINTAIFTALNSDPTLRALVPDGVFWDLGNAGSTAFVVLSGPSDAEHANALGDADGWDRFTYTAKAVIQSASVTISNNAAFRIHELLHRGLTDLTAGNYRILHVERILPIRYMEVDPQNTAAKWQHHGGQYEVMVCPADS
jgi:hypothetical protein